MTMFMKSVLLNYRLLYNINYDAILFYDSWDIGTP